MNHNILIFFGIILIALGITFNTALKEEVGTLGIIIIAIGSLFFVIGMRMRFKKDRNSNESQNADQ